MDAASLHTAITGQRRDFADLIIGLTAEQLAVRSLCGEWTVQEVAGHISFAAKPDLREFGAAVLRHRGNFDRANDVIAKRYGDRPVDTIVGHIREVADSRTHPPGPGGRYAPLADILLHTTDVREPLQLSYDPPADAVRQALIFLASSPFGFVRRGRLKGLRLVAPDVSFEHGSGELVEGRGIDLAMAMTGRASALSRLNGHGVEVLRSRSGG